MKTKNNSSVHLEITGLMHFFREIRFFMQIVLTFLRIIESSAKTSDELYNHFSLQSFRLEKIKILKFYYALIIISFKKNFFTKSIFSHGRKLFLVYTNIISCPTYQFTTLTRLKRNLMTRSNCRPAPISHFVIN